MRKAGLSAALTLIVVFMVQAQPDNKELRQWEGLKYSMFIHYGIYSIPAGVWEGEQIQKGLSEQIQAHAGIYSDTYGALASKFNPSHWNADSIALLAKSAGMRSIVITSKHHDGFCMFKSDYTDFDVVDATPFKRDIVKELSEACHRHGLKFGLYFSLIDWHYPQASPISSHNSDYITPEHHIYNKNQVTELLTRYGMVSELWFDMGSQSKVQSKELRDLVHKLQPGCLVSSRIGNDQGDFTVVGDNQEPDYDIGVPWQSPASFFDETWGYRSWQERGDEADKTKEKLSSLIRVVSRGGNYLLNIGPKGDGSIVGFEKHVLLAIGQWLSKNGKAIYGTRPDPFRVAFDWGNITTSADEKNMFLMIRQLPANGLINLPGLKGTIKRAYVLSNNIIVKFSQGATGARINLPENFTVNDEFKVVVLEFKEKFSVSPSHQLEEHEGKFVLNSQIAFKSFSSSCIDYNTRFSSIVKESWWLHTGSEKNIFIPQLFYTEGEVGKDIVISIDGRDNVVSLGGDEKIGLQEPLNVTYGPVYLAGPLSSSLDEIPGNITEIDVGKPWPSNANGAWQAQTNWQQGKINSYPASAMTAYYFLQEITSGSEQRLIVNVSSGDGVMIFLNGKELLIDLNHDREKIAEHVILLQLKKGKNQLLIKSFDNFRKEVICSIDHEVKPVLYIRELEPIAINAKIFPVSWKLHAPETPHQNILMQNVSLEIIRTGKQKP